MFVGSHTLCLKVKDLAASKRFYEALGLRIIEEIPGTRVVMERGSFNLALMTFLDGNCMNFRGTDVFATHDALRARGLDLLGKPNRYSAQQVNGDADGACWLTFDPDGNAVFFDTNANEAGDAHRRRRVRQILEGAEQDLLDAGASPECLRALRREILDKFAAE
jgi:catechol 2,3-dioxygenase-like lactoylglutathione lyase family enzyme